MPGNASSRAADPAAAVSCSGNDSTVENSAATANRQAQRCACCSHAGEPPRIVWDRSKEPPGVVLTPVFGWHADGRPALLCSSCKAKAAKARMTGRRR
jgi:hypothetical protein